MTTSTGPDSTRSPQTQRPSTHGELIDTLTDGPRPPVPPRLADNLNTAFRVAAADIFNSRPPQHRLYLGAHQLALIDDCQGRTVAELTHTFRWNLATVRRGLVIEAIRTWVSQHRALPATAAADHAVRWASTGGDNHTLSDLNRGTFLADLDPHTRSGLTADIAAAITSYDHLVHPRVDRCDIRFTQRPGLRTPHAVFRAAVDLVCGRSRPGDDTARKLLINFTLGAIQPSHLTHLRRAALYETIATATPPRRCAAVTLAAGDEAPIQVIDITPTVLWETAYTTIDAAARYARLDRHRQNPILRPGPCCDHCPAQASCPPSRLAPHIGEQDPTHQPPGR